MIKSKDEILQAISAKIGDDNSDEALGLYEDISDTLSDYETRVSDSADWKKKYEDNDAEWREKYKERFLSGSDEPTPTGGVTETILDAEETEKPTTYEELFTEE